MATGLLIGGAVSGIIGGIGKKKAADKNYKAIQESVERSREVEKIRLEAETKADKALEQANKDFLKAAEGKFANDMFADAEWSKANQQRRALELENIQYGIAEANEAIRRQERSDEIVEGRAQTATSASGFGGGSSLDKWTQTIASTHQDNISWMVESRNTQARLAREDANLQFQGSEGERKLAMKNAELGLETGQAQFEFYEAQRSADAIMREADRAQRESDREYALASGDASKIGASWGAASSIIGGVASGFSGFSGARAKGFT